MVSIRKDNMKRHELEFMEEHIRNKRRMEEEEGEGERVRVESEGRKVS